MTVSSLIPSRRALERLRDTLNCSLMMDDLFEEDELLEVDKLLEENERSRVNVGMRCELTDSALMFLLAVSALPCALVLIDS